MDTLRSMQERPNLQLVLGLGAAAVLIFLVAVIGAFMVGGDDTQVKTAATAEGTDEESDLTAPEAEAEGTATTVAADPGTTLPGTSGTIQAGGKVATTAKPGTKTTTKPAAGITRPTSGAGDRTGITDKTVRWALHAPVTFDGAPLNLAEDPLEGVSVYIKYLNDQGGINGRKIEYKVFDDRYTVEGGKAAANALVNDYKPFFASGTLGVDQIFQVASEARKRGVPYIAGGGSESIFKNISMFQVSSSYDTHLEKLADFLGKEIKKTPADSPYSGLKRVGVTMLDTPYIQPAVDRFKEALSANGMELVKVVKVQKPTEQTSYASQIQGLKDANAQIVVPAQDPITTSREVQECVSQRCPWKWSFSNFAHESDVALQLQGGQWVGYRGLSGGCYYQHANEGDPKKCGQLKEAHAQWVKVNGEDDWKKDGQGGTAGYQLVHLWMKALKDAGNDPTRERFRAALLTYDGYSDLVSGPITYKGSPNLSHGYTKMVVFQAGADKYTQLTPGFVDGF
ncbi:MAG TPA: ABC transporter substrate-binding protein [Acidimicrobiales bacterium]|nr:ABC transporter substrate-binding protein [Acidimicrobiales bacterium]